MELQKAQSRTQRGPALDEQNKSACICFQEVLLENTEYNIERDYEFYETIPPVQKSKRGTAIAVRKELPHKG